MIIQGDNKPITLRLSVPAINITYLNAVMLNPAGSVLKTWTEETADISGQYLKLPITQAETIKLPCTIIMDIKYVADGDIQFIEKFPMNVELRTGNTRIFPVEGDES